MPAPTAITKEQIIIEILKFLFNNDLNSGNVSSLKYIDKYKLLSQLYLREHFYGLIDFKNQTSDTDDIKCNDQDFLMAYQSLVDVTTFLFSANYIKKDIFVQNVVVTTTSKEPANIVSFAKTHSTNISKFEMITRDYDKHMLMTEFKRYVFCLNIVKNPNGVL